MASGEIVVKNIVEDIVEVLLDECIERAGICGCEQCRSDVKAYALNHLPPRYVSRLRGDLMARVDATKLQGKADVIAALLAAAAVVGANPRHSDNR